MLDVLIQNASIVDGTGVPAYQGSVGIRAGSLPPDSSTPTPTGT